MKKNIVVLCSKEEFSVEQLSKLDFSGQVSFVNSKSESSLEDLIKLSKNADIIGFSPDKIGKSASEWLFQILEKSPNVKGLALNTISSDYIDENYCKERGIRVFTVPDYKAEAVAEHVLLFLLGSAKRAFINERRTYRRKYKPELGFEIAGKRLGIVGSDLTAQKVARLAKGLGMAVYATARFEDVYRQELDGLLRDSDFISIHLPNTEENKKFLNKERISRLKQNAIVINLAGREIVDEREMSKSLLSGSVSQYLFESESMNKSPLEDIETALMFKPYSGLTREAQERNKYWWVRSIANLAGVPTS